MKHTFKMIILLSAICMNSFGQTKYYTTTGLELIFSWATISDNTSSESSNLRFAPVINLQTFYNADINEHFGLFTGVAIRNVGYIYGNYKQTSVTNSITTTVTQEKRFRSYNFGIPIGIKLGNLNKSFLYTGYEMEIPFLYKEKTYDNGDKTDKITGWFSNRQQSFYHSILFGIQFPYGMNVKFKYYLTEFHNQGFTSSDGSQPYAGLNSHVFTVSLNALLLRDNGLNTPEEN